MIQTDPVRLTRTRRGACRELAAMNQNESANCPRVLAKQLEHMIEFADKKQDYVLAAWLAQALERIKDNHIAA
jgi:hypothetical protein